MHEREPGGKIMLSVLEGNIRLGPGEIRSLAHMNRVTQRGAGRHVNLVQQMPEPRKLGLRVKKCVRNRGFSRIDL